MTKVFSAHAVSVDGYISGRTPDGEEEFGRGLGDAPMLFDWYMDGDTPSKVFDGFRLSEPSARFFDAIAVRVGVAVAGRTTYEHSGHWGGGGPHPTARVFVLSHRPAPEINETQTLVTSGIEDAIAAARAAPGAKDVALMGGGVLTSALAAGLVELANALQAITPGLRLDLLPGRQTGPGDDPYLDTTRLTHDTGFAPTFDVAAAVADYVTWRADNPR
jgi:dihydrofolate reductase